MAITCIGKCTFPGGTHPADSKGLTAEKQIQQGPACKQVTVMLSQHIGAPCKAIVNKADEVKAGQKVGDVEAFVSAPVYSPINGKVKEISLQSHAVLGRSDGIIIEAGDDNPAKQPCADQFTESFDDSGYSDEQIRDAIRNAGIVGLGGAGFPTSVKVLPNEKSPKQAMIVNACECEPYITCDYRIMLEWTNQIIAGIMLAKRASGCPKVFIGIEDNKPAAIESMSSALAKFKNTDDISVVPVKTKYPQGGERQLIKSVLDIDVPTGSIPPMVGVLVMNVATAAAIAEAVVLNQPLTHRVVTVSGEGVKNPGNYYVPIGISAGELIEFCGGLTEDASRIIMGGPMMGIAIADLSTPLTKASGAITVLTKKQIGKAKFENRTTPCIRCGRCLTVCPEHLNPTKIAHAVKYDNLELGEKYYIDACISCGCCSYVCPANIELAGHIKTGKVLLARQRKRMAE